MNIVATPLHRAETKLSTSPAGNGPSQQPATLTPALTLLLGWTRTAVHSARTCTNEDDLLSIEAVHGTVGEPEAHVQCHASDELLLLGVELEALVEACSSPRPGQLARGDSRPQLRAALELEHEAAR